MATDDDTASRKREKRASQQILRMCQSVAEHAPCSIWICDGDGTITFANRSSLALFGVTDPSQIIGRYNIYRDTTEAEKPLLANFERAWAGEVIRYRQDLDMTTVKYATRRREALHLLSTLFAIPAVSGQRPYIVVMQEDITELVRMEEALRESAEQLRLITDGSPAAISYVDKNQHYRFNNKTYEQWFGRSRDEITGRHIKEILGEPAYQAIRGYVEAALSGEQVTFDTVLPLKDAGSRHISVTYSPYFGQRGEVEGFVALVTDISERKRLEEALQKAREQLETKVERQMLRRNPYGLTFRELTVLHLVAAGRTDKEIGAELGISPLTAQKHVSNILTKMEATSRTEAVARALREGLLD